MLSGRVIHVSGSLGSNPGGLLFPAVPSGHGVAWVYRSARGGSLFLTDVALHDDCGYKICASGLRELYWAMISYVDLCW